MMDLNFTGVMVRKGAATCVQYSNPDPDNGRCDPLYLDRNSLKFDAASSSWYERQPDGFLLVYGLESSLSSTSSLGSSMSGSEGSGFSSTASLSSGSSYTASSSSGSEESGSSSDSNSGDSSSDDSSGSESSESGSGGRSVEYILCDHSSSGSSDFSSSSQEVNSIEYVLCFHGSDGSGSGDSDSDSSGSESSSGSYSLSSQFDSSKSSGSKSSGSKSSGSESSGSEGSGSKSSGSESSFFSSSLACNPEMEFGYVRNLLPWDFSVPFLGTPVRVTGAEYRAGQPMLCSIDQEVYCGAAQPVAATYDRGSAAVGASYSVASFPNGLDRANQHVRANAIGYRVGASEMGNNCGATAGTSGVNVNNGNLVLTYGLPGAGPVDPPLRLFYNSMANDDSMNSRYGLGWSEMYFQWVEESQNVTSDGENLKTYLSEMVSPAGLKWVFDRHASGETKSIQCPDSTSVTYGYDARGNLASITDSVGRTTLVSIDSNGLLLSITDPESGVTSFGYDENDQLISWQNPSGNTTFFDYDSCFRVKSITTPKGEVTRYKYRESEPRQRIVTNARGFVTTLTLDDYGNVVTSQEPVSASETITEEYQWDAKQRLLSFKDGRNNRTTFTYEEMTDRSRRLKTVQRPIGTMAFTYGDKDNARLTSIADQENNVTTLQWEFLESGASMYPGGLTTLTDAENKNWLYEYNSAGQITTITDPNFLMASSWGFDSSYRTKTVSPAPGEVTTFTYDQYSRVEQTNSNITTSTFAVTTTTRDLVNRVLLNTDANGLSTILEYDVDGLNDDVIDPMGGSWPKTYDLNGRLESTSTPENSKTTFTYDEVGNRITSKSPRGYTTTFTFDRLNRLIQTEDPLTRKTYQTFDAASNLQSVANNLLETTTYTYDANNRRTEELDPLSRKTTFAYDKVGNEIGTTNNANEKTTTTYDARYMVKTVSSPVGGVTSKVTNTYDAGGRLIQIENALGNKSYIGYDNANRPITGTTPKGFVTTTVYDSMGRPTVVINAESERVTTVYDPGGRVTNTVVSPDGSLELVTSYSYDDNGNQTETIVPVTSLTSATSGTVYDAANRVIANVDPLGHRTTFTLDADGNRVAVTNAMSEMSSSLYNFANELTVEFTPMGFDTVYEYDGAGRLNRVVDANGNVTTTMYDPAGQPTTVINGAGDTSETYYDAVGRPEVLVDGAFVRTTIVYYPGGLEKNRYMQPKAGVSLIVTTMQYDAAGRLTTAINGAGDTVVTEYDTDDRLTTVINGEGEQTITYYDKVNRPTIVQNPLGQLFTTYYDGMGREINTVDAVANTTTTVYDYASRPVNEINGAGNKTTTTYDLAGRITAVTDGSGRTVTTEYDDANRPITVTTGGGLERTVTNYDLDGRPTTVTNAASDVTVTEFDAGARPIAVIDGVGNRTTTVYDGADRPTVVINPKFERTTTTYDGAERVVAVENARGNTTTYDYDDAGRQICVKTPSPLNERTTTTYDDANRVIAVEDARGNSTTTQYDKASRPTTVTDPLGKLTVTEYDAAGRPTTLTNAESEKTVTDYDSAGRPTTVTRPLGIVVSTDFDGANRPVSVTTGGGSIPFMTSVTVYDGAGRPEVLIDPRTNRTTTTYDAAGRPFKVEDAENNVTTTVYDGAGRVKEVINAESETTTTLYDHAGRMTALINGRGKITTYHYDVASRMDYKIDPLSRRTTYVYDQVGNLYWKETARGTKVTNTWDVNNRLTVEAYSDGRTHTYTYDAVGNRIQVAGPYTGGSVGTYTMTYTNRNELWTEKNPDDKVTTYTYYNVVDRRKTLVDPDDGTTTYSYDAAGRQEVVTNPHDKGTTFSYDTANRQTQKSLPNGVFVEWTHDKNGNILSIYTSKIGGINKRVTYTYDDVNNKTSQIDQDDRLVQWTYDNVYRLRNEECSVAPPTPYELFYSITYTYDDAGNRATQTKTEGTDPAEVTVYTNDAADQLSYEVTTIGTTVSRITYTYDGCGNRTVKETASGDVYYSYSAANQMLTQDSASGTVTMSYNGMYQRIQKESGSGSALTNFIYDMNRLLAETDVNGDTTKSYTSETDGSSYGGMISEFSIADMAEAYPDYDAQWSTKDLIDENGNSTAVYRNTAFGLPSPEPTNSASLSVSQWSELSVDDSSNLGVGDEAGANGFGAQAGYFNDQETDLYLMGGGGQGRYYDPEVGRFTTQDPIGEAGGINLTQFVNNNPVNATDSSGNFTDERPKSGKIKGAEAVVYVLKRFLATNKKEMSWDLDEFYEDQSLYGVMSIIGRREIDGSLMPALENWRAKNYSSEYLRRYFDMPGKFESQVQRTEILDMIRKYESVLVNDGFDVPSTVGIPIEELDFQRKISMRYWHHDNPELVVKVLDRFFSNMSESPVPFQEIYEIQPLREAMVFAMGGSHFAATSNTEFHETIERFRAKHYPDKAIQFRSDHYIFPLDAETFLKRAKEYAENPESLPLSRSSAILEHLMVEGAYSAATIRFLAPKQQSAFSRGGRGNQSFLRPRSQNLISRANRIKGEQRLPEKLQNEINSRRTSPIYSKPELRIKSRAAAPRSSMLTGASLDDQVNALVNGVEGLSERQARAILEKAFSGQNPTSVTIGGSRIKLNSRKVRPDSDIDIGFGNLTQNQATKLVRKIRKDAEKLGGLIPEGRIQIVPGKSTKTIPEIISPEEFFQRSGIRSLDDLHRPGQPFGPSGSITVTPNGEIRIIYP